MAATYESAAQTQVESLVGHPDVKFGALKSKIQDDVVEWFRDVDDQFLDLIWTLDQYRIRQVVPRGMGNARYPPDRRLEGIYRGKGNYFSAVMALILGNKTTSQLASRSDIQGFSQTHQIDIAWPARETVPLVDPYICAEAKLTGAPPYENNKGRGAMDDWSNRRKELKFQAADLKLYRHMAEGSRIEHWDLWRRRSLPRVYSLWAARLSPDDDFRKMVREARTLSETYCDGVGIYAFQEKPDGTGYEPTQVSRGV
ncbi:MAG TPA: hypothetical protein VKG38_11875, partial [Solirubrobacteraceae bacterium]|nr:hypothetical protein [Solirubrobacteraceae bacterium]